MFYLKMHMNVVCVCTCICVHSLHGQNKEFCSVLFCSDMLQSVIVSGAVIYHISNVNGVLQYTRITALCNIYIRV